MRFINGHFVKQGDDSKPSKESFRLVTVLSFEVEKELLFTQR